MRGTYSAILVFLGWALVASRPLGAQDLGAAAKTKENLDLPIEAEGVEEDPEDAPEVVLFYGQAFEGDGIIYVIDKSCTMQDEGELDIAKREVVRNIREFSDKVWFGIVFFSNDVVKFPSSGMPAQAEVTMRDAAISFVMTMEGHCGTCCQQGLAEGLQMANLATPKHKAIIYVGDGGGTCPGTTDEASYLQKTLTSITFMNYQRVVINCIGVLRPLPLNEEFMKKLSSSNGGTYTKISR